MQRILSYMRKTIETYNLIEEGDKIAVGLSGGKDSITLLMGLKALQRFYGKHFELIAITVNPGFEFFNSDFLKQKCKEIGVPLVEEVSHIKEIVFDIRKEQNPCSLCANLRRGIINSVATREELIRPLIDTPEKEIKKFIKKNNIEVMKKVCPMDGFSKREDMKNLIFELEKSIPNIKANMIGAIKRSNISGWKIS